MTIHALTVIIILLLRNITAILYTSLFIK